MRAATTTSPRCRAVLRRLLGVEWRAPDRPAGGSSSASAILRRIVRAAALPCTAPCPHHILAPATGQLGGGVRHAEKKRRNVPCRAGHEHGHTTWRRRRRRRATTVKGIREGRTCRARRVKSLRTNLVFPSPDLHRSHSGKERRKACRSLAWPLILPAQLGPRAAPQSAGAAQGARTHSPRSNERSADAQSVSLRATANVPSRRPSMRLLLLI